MTVKTYNINQNKKRFFAMYNLCVKGVAIIATMIFLNPIGATGKEETNYDRYMRIAEEARKNGDDEKAEEYEDLAETALEASSEMHEIDVIEHGDQGG